MTELESGARVARHAFVDRLFHWLSAASVLTLMATAFLPILGMDFAWVTIHWIAGMVLALLVSVHIVRSLIWQRIATVWIGLRDIREAWAAVRNAAPVRVGGKYSLAQKAIHNAFAVVVLTAVATGGLMLVKVDTPWWDRDPYWLSDVTWGVIYVLHDFASLCLVTMVITHIYFALRPEKLYLLRSMILGWITGAEYERNYDVNRWSAERTPSNH
jgi:cytochrome b subunit of formate dehydrogenase